jgi:hypothetical protein
VDNYCISPAGNDFVFTNASLLTVNSKGQGVGESIPSSRYTINPSSARDRTLRNRLDVSTRFKGLPLRRSILIIEPSDPTGLNTCLSSATDLNSFSPHEGKIRPSAENVGECMQNFAAILIAEA